jgi:predicted esterase
MTRCYKGRMHEDVEVRSVEARTHGRVLVRRGDPRRLLVGFHGYAESAEMHLRELLQIRAAADWTVVAVQALNRFYNRRTPEVVASWMTSQDREQTIEDNLLYVRSVVMDFGSVDRLVFAGFSQGAAMAYRAAAAMPSDALLILGGDVPPDVVAQKRVQLLPPVLVGRGSGDEWFTAEKLEKDLSFLREAAERVETCLFEGGHEWSAEFRAAASAMLPSG